MSVSKLTLVPQILIGVAAGAALGAAAPEVAGRFGILGGLFVSMLKAVAPLLVLALVMSAIANRRAAGGGRKTAAALGLYFVGTLSAALVALLLSMAFPQTIALAGIGPGLAAADGQPPVAVSAVLADVLFKLIDNPVNALLQGNFLGCLVWAVLLGISFRRAPAGFREHLQSFADGMADIVRYVIRLAPIGIFGLVCATVAAAGLEALKNYASIAALLVAAMLLVALLVNPLIVFACTRRSPWPVVLRCLQESGLTAFFTRSSAANIPVNLALAERLGISKDLYSVTIPVGATVNMAGAAITITVLTLAAVNTLGIEVDFAAALVLCAVAVLTACGSSGVPSGSLLLVPLACSLFGIPLDTAMQVVAVGFVISVAQDSMETALNSSTDVVYTYAAERLGTE